MFDVIITILSVLAIAFAISSLVGLFLAFRDIRKNKNSDCSFRKTRKERIKESSSDFSNTPDLSVLSQLADLSDDEKELFKSELEKRFNEVK